MRTYINWLERVIQEFTNLLNSEKKLWGSKSSKYDK